MPKGGITEIGKWTLHFSVCSILSVWGHVAAKRTTKGVPGEPGHLNWTERSKKLFRREQHPAP